MQTRNQILDIMKGIGILFVVFGHAIARQGSGNGFSQTVINWIYTFHMPLFFFISGYIMHETIKGNRLIWIGYKALYLLIPHYIFNFLFYYRDYLLGFKVQRLSQVYTLPQWIWHSVYLIEGDWFLWALFMCFTLMLLVDWVDRKYNNKIFWIFTIGLIILLGIVVIPGKYIWFSYYDLKFFGPIMLVGYIIARNKVNLRNYFVPVCLLGMLTFPLVTRMYNGVNRPHIDLLRYILSGGLDYYFIKYSQAFSGVLVVLLVANVISRFNMISLWISRLGIISLGIYLFHSFIPVWWLASLDSEWGRIIIWFVFGLTFGIITTITCKKVKILSIAIGDVSFFRKFGH
jgi:fucose 4-O-acetylase-like acetyltransferase